MSTDAELLHRYARNREERAFAELVERHLGVVYGVAHRRTGGRVQLAEEVAQKVFCDLARRAATLQDHPALIGWLYRATRNAAIDAVRREGRQQKISHTLATMPDTAPNPEEQVDWARLRPVLDEALDQLKQSDREAMLLRYFEGLSFAEVGAHLALSENAARMRTERALDKLREQLSRRGVTSTTAALGLLLSNQAFAVVPAGLATSVTAAAISTAPVTGVVAFFLMSKITTPLLCAVAAAGVTTLVWTYAAPKSDSARLAALRQENTRLLAAAGESTSSAAPSGAPVNPAVAIADIMAQRHKAGSVASTAAGGSATAGSSRSEVSPHGHRFHGRATPKDAALTFAWAGDISDPDEMAELVTFEPEVRALALAELAKMPEAVRQQFPTPEAFYGMLLAASTVEAPPPSADVIERLMVVVETGPGRAATRKPNSDKNTHEYQQTADGWKYILPVAGVKGLPTLLKDETLAKLSRNQPTASR